MIRDDRIEVDYAIALALRGITDTIGRGVDVWFSANNRSTSASLNLTQLSTRKMGSRPEAAMVSTFRSLMANRFATSALVNN